MASTLTASFSSFLAAPKVFQMLCNDKIYHNLTWFGFSNKSGEPIRADILTTVIVLLFILPGTVNYRTYNNYDVINSNIELV